MAGALAGLPAFDPIGQVVPFNYRDTATNMSMLHGLREKLNELVDALNAGADVNTSEHNRIVRDLTAQFNNALADLQYNLEAQISALQLDGATAFDPTTGKRDVNLSQVVSNVYDNTRIFAYFAGQLDDFGWTAAEYDTHIDTARHFDLAPTYPVLNDVLKN